MERKHKAIFLDRDGVINKEVNYLHRAEDFTFTHNCISAIRMLREAGYKILVVTNQAGIGRGYYTEADLNILMGWLKSELTKNGADIDDYAFCPHHPTEALGKYKKHCKCRKPEPGMLISLIQKHNIDVINSIMVGDKLSDLEAAQAAGIPKNILVKTGHKFDENDVPCQWDIFETLYSFALHLTKDN